LKELFNEPLESTSTSDVGKPTLPTSNVSTVVSNDEMASISADTSADGSSENKKDAQFVSIYHSYASKTTPDYTDESSNTQNTIVDSLSDVKAADETQAEIENDAHSPVANLTPPSSSNDENKSSFSKSKHKIGNEADEDLVDEEEEDYYDDEDDELSRIKQKYSMLDQEEGGETFDDDYEDCGF